MIRSYLRIAVRNLIKEKWISLINVTGLALGMACSILIMLWVQDEMSVDQFHEKIDNLYRVGTWVEYGNRREQGSGTPPILGPILTEENSEILNAVRFANGSAEVLTRYGDVSGTEHMAMADPTVFEMFSFPFVMGNPKDTFGDPRVIVLNETMAEKYFGNKNPIGETITLDTKYDFKVVGVMKDIPHNSTIQFQFWLPFSFIPDIWNGRIDTWYNLAHNTYIELDPKANYRQVSKKISGRIKQSFPQALTEPYLYPFADIYLIRWGNLGIVMLFSMIAIGILSIACINFINLSTARSARRAREVGIRKVVGAERGQIMKQFFSETVIYTMLALITAILLVELFLPSFGLLTRKPLQLNYLSNTTLLFGVVCITIFTGIIAGLYPAAFLSSFKPIKVIKSGSPTISSKSTFRKILVIAQFSLSIILIISTVVVYKQTQFMKYKDLGFNKDLMIYIPLKGELRKKHSAFKNEASQYHGISSLTLTSRSPVGVYTNGQNWQWEGRRPDTNPLVTYLAVDEDYLKTFQMKMADGKFYAPELAVSGNHVVVNERFQEIMGFDSAVNQKLYKGDESYNILGVIKNFHFKPVYANIGPIILFYGPDRHSFRYLFMRVNSDELNKTIAFLKKTVKKINPDFPFEFFFLDEDYNRLYMSIERVNHIISIFALLAIFISCLGLFGLISYIAEQRTKEISIRKVMGAHVINIVTLLSKEFTKWVLLANLIAWPVAWLLMKMWLQNFAYNTELAFWIFAASGAVALIVALITVSSQAIKAALSNPVDALKYE
ncbi:MAG: ABC transporter permease [Calditrichales bacterium]|nr:ABC transporter permease [Calditrichales bacterium]